MLRLTHNDATVRNTKCYWVSFGHLHVLYSYSTPVYAQYDGEYVKRETISRTTTRHVREVLSGSTLTMAKEVNEDTMDLFITHVIADQVSREAVRKIEEAA